MGQPQPFACLHWNSVSAHTGWGQGFFMGLLSTSKAGLQGTRENPLKLYARCCGYVWCGVFLFFF